MMFWNMMKDVLMKACLMIQHTSNLENSSDYKLYDKTTKVFSRAYVLYDTNLLLVFVETTTSISMVAFAAYLLSQNSFSTDTFIVVLKRHFVRSQLTAQSSS